MSYSSRSISTTSPSRRCTSTSKLTTYYRVSSLHLGLKNLVFLVCRVIHRVPIVLLIVRPANALYTIPPAALAAPAEASPAKDRPDSPTPPINPITADADVPAVNDQPGEINTEGAVAETGAVPTEATEPQPEAGENTVEDENMDEETHAPPTTRSKTLPMRKPPTPPPRSPSPTEIKRGVVTLSDVEAARAVLAEKANAHWGRGLGGGQNREGETIVNFLYKLKAGPSELSPDLGVVRLIITARLLRVYNPWPAT